jgi:hypothetical protein
MGRWSRSIDRFAIGPALDGAGLAEALTVPALMAAWAAAVVLIDRWWRGGDRVRGGNVSVAPRFASPVNCGTPCDRIRSALHRHPRRRAAGVHEIKHDGYRLQVRRVGDQIRLFTRRARPSIDTTGQPPASVSSTCSAFAEFKTMTACRSLDFQIEFAHQSAPLRFLGVDVGGIVLRGARQWHGSLGPEPRAHVIR